MACTLSILVDSLVYKRFGCGYIKTGTVTTISRWVNAGWNYAQLNHTISSDTCYEIWPTYSILKCCNQQQTELANLK